MDFVRFIPRPNQVAVFFFAGIVLLAETVLFHTTKFVVDYVLAVTVIGCAVAGIGLGALLASRLRCPEADIFPWCCGGTTVCLYVAAWVLLRQPHLELLLPAIATVFVFPSTFIARSFARSEARGIYFFDMLGAGTAVGVTVYVYRYLGSEEIFLALVTAVPLAGMLWTGLLWTGLVPTYRGWRRFSDCLGLLLLGGVGATLFYQQVTTDALNIVRIVNPEAPNIPTENVLRRPSRLSITKTYDNLLGRIDAMPKGNRTFVTYDGFFNDNFFDNPPRDYLKYVKPHQLHFPSSDRRVVYGLVPEPQVFVVGAAADGILKTLRMITPLDHIDAVEVNPGILQMMQHDFLAQSGRVYEGLNVRRGNALSILQRTEKEYDIITLVNTHSSRWVGALGPPDYLQTHESYELYFDHLTPEGYLLFEERPATWRGELGVKRMILTLYDCLKQRGVKDPADHFFIWEFMSNRFHNQGGTGIKTGSDMYYVGMIVSLNPIRGKRRQDLLEWYDLDWVVYWDEREQPIHYLRKQRPHAAYLKGKWHGERFGPFFDMLESGDFAQLDPDFDASVVTNDRPFPSCSTHSVPDIERLVGVTSGVCFLLGSFITIGALRGVRRRQQISRLVAYNIAIGSAYFFVEIMLIQAYQGVFLSPSTALVLVLGVLLVGSGLGGLAAKYVTPGIATVTLFPVLLLALWTPEWVLSLGLSTMTSSIVASCAVLLVGLNMGNYFPNGLMLARRWSLRGRIPHLFAINSVAGSLATAWSFYLGIRIGYTWTVAIALLLYVVASVVYWSVARVSDPSVSSVPSAKKSRLLFSLTRRQ